VEADEMASFVKKKANKQWIWIAMDGIVKLTCCHAMTRPAGGPLHSD
jgi:IS1 family transposase